MAAATEKKSKKLVVYSSSSSMGFGAAGEIESNDDLLMSILVGLPPKSVFRFRCVSKRWNDIVVDPFFIRSYYETRKRELERIFSSKGMNDLTHFIQTKTYLTHSCDDWLYRNNDPRSNVWHLRNKIYGVSSSSSNDRSKNVPKKFGFLFHSDNGLILCGRRRTNTYHVLNPFVRTCVSLPPPPPPKLIITFKNSIIIFIIGLVVCEEENTISNNLVPNFKVVKVRIELFGKSSKFLQIQTYSSKNREWTHSTLVGTENFVIHYGKPNVFVFNGVLHWFTMDGGLAVYDSLRDHNNHVQLIILPLPYAAIKEFDYYNVIRDDDNILWCSVNNRREKWLELWMLPKNRGGGGRDYRRSTTISKKEWILMHTITHDLMLPKDIITHECLSIEPLWLFPKKAVFCVEKFMICIYNYETKSMESSFPIGDKLLPKSISLYMKPLSLSSYALSAKAYDDHE